MKVYTDIDNFPVFLLFHMLFCVLDDLYLQVSVHEFDIVVPQFSNFQKFGICVVEKL